MEAELRLRKALVEYLCGGHRSIDDVRQIEGLLPRDLADKPVFEELAEILALYRVDTEAGYADDRQLAAEVRWVLDQLRFAGCP